ncbi:MAG: glycosyl hydrolase [Kiritimatiellia bacterium]
MKNLFWAGVLAAASASALDFAAFQSPAAGRHPETWFHLIGGNVAKAGLDADLDAIKAAGISGIQLFHGQFGGPWPGVSPQIPCLSADWDDLIKYAAEGCAKRGLVFKMQNCPGWSMSGGPWITPDRAMRNLTYARRDVEGGSPLDIALPEPDWQMESRLSRADLDYRDLFVLAFPTPAGDDGAAVAPKPAAQSDANGVMRRLYRFDKPIGVRAIELPSPSSMNHANSYTPDARVRLAALKDGVRTTVLDQAVPQGVWQDGVPMTFACDEVSATEWEFVLEHAHAMNIPQVKFHAGARLNNWEGLAGWVLRGLVKRPAPKQNAAGYVKADRVLDITDKFKDGRLVWTPPAGKWTILRIGHVNNGTRNGPAPQEATGWECNKMDRGAIDLHFASYIGRLAKGPLAGGKLKGFVVDSWECRRQTWTATLEADFRAANGYDFRKKLPAVFGWVLDDPATTERFLLDWRRTLGELVERNYYARMNELARSLGMTAQYETAFGDVLPGDLMSFWKWCDVPMCEFWHPRTPDFVGQDDFKPVYPCASATHVYGKGRCAAEAFTCMNLKWNETLADLKRTGNHALARGVTHLVFHTYTHNPRTDALPPGTSFGHHIGTAFIRGQTWWGAMREFTDYFARCEVMLEAGRPASDVLWFLGDEVGHKPSETSPLPAGFRYDYCNPDALLTRVSVADGRLVLPDGVSYAVLWVPEGTYVAPKSEAKLQALAAAGARVVRGTPAAAVAGLSPDLAVGANARSSAVAPLEPDIDWIRRTGEGEDWYFISANGPMGYKGVLDFRRTGAVQLWDPVTGAREAAQVVGTARGRTQLAVDFACGESRFVVFGNTPAPPAVAGKPGPAEQVAGWTLSFPAGWGAPASLELDELASWTDLPLSEEARHFSGTATYATTLHAAQAGMAELDLGRVASVAAVHLNGTRVRILWAPPYRCRIPLKKGRNALRVDVTNTWFNRLAFDAGQPEQMRKTWTIAAPRKGTPPEAAGLLGPVTLTR